MSKKYTIPEEDSQIVSEPAAIMNPRIGVADALWTLILNQSEDVQNIIADRLGRLRKSHNVSDYTIDEINARIDEAEAQILSGDVLSGEEVHSRMRDYINSIAL